MKYENRKDAKKRKEKSFILFIKRSDFIPSLRKDFVHAFAFHVQVDATAFDGLSGGEPFAGVVGGEN